MILRYDFDLSMTCKVRSHINGWTTVFDEADNMVYAQFNDMCWWYEYNIAGCITNISEKTSYADRVTDYDGDGNVIHTYIYFDKTTEFLEYYYDSMGNGITQKEYDKINA